MNRPLEMPEMLKTPEHPDFPGMLSFRQPLFLQFSASQAAMLPTIAFELNEEILLTAGSALLVASGDMEPDEVALPLAVSCKIPEEDADKKKELFTKEYVGAALMHFADSNQFSLRRLARYEDGAAMDIKIMVDVESVHVSGQVWTYYGMIAFPSTVEEAMEVAKTNMNLANAQFTALTQRLLVPVADSGKVH